MRSAHWKAESRDCAVDLRQIAYLQRNCAVEERCVINLQQGKVAIVADEFDGCGIFFDDDISAVRDVMGVGEDSVAFDDKAASDAAGSGVLLPGRSVIVALFDD